MVIRLASAIGSQREPIGILGGLDDAINKTGDAIQAANQRKAAEEAKKRDAALQAAINIDTDIDAMKEDNEVYKQTAKKLISDTFSLYANGASPMEIAAKKKEAEEILAPMKYRYEKDKQDYAKIQEFVSKGENQDKYDFTEAENFLLGKDTREVPMPAQAPTGRTMPVNKEDSDITEVVDIQETPYWKKELGDRQKQAPSSAYSEFMSRVKDITGNFNDASLGYFGKDWSPKDQYSSLVTTENAGGLDVEKVVIDENKIARDKAAFLSSAGTDLGDAKTKQYFRTLANKAGAAGKRAGLQGEELNTFVKENVLKAAAQDFDNRVLQDIEKTKIKTIDKDPDKESKGFSINFMGNGKYQTKTGFYQVDKDKTDTETREQQFRNFEERNKDQIIVNWAKQYVKYPPNATDTDIQNAKDKAVEKATKMYESESGKKSVQELFDKSYPQGKKVTKVYPALTPKQDGSNPEVNVVDSKGKTIAFTPSFYNIDETTHKPISVYGVEVVKEKGDDGVTRTIQKPVVIPYNAKNKVVNNVAPELAEVYKKETGKDINLEVDGKETTTKAAAKGETAEQRRARLKKELIK